jgi:hypothetical protein
LWHGLAGFVFFLLCLAWVLPANGNSGQTIALEPSIGKFADVMNVVVLGWPALFHFLACLAPGSMTRFTMSAFSKRPGVFRFSVYRFNDGTLEALLAAAYVPWAVIAYFLAGAWLGDLLQQIGLYVGTAFGFRLTIALTAPFYVVMLFLAGCHARRLSASSLAGARVSTERRKDMVASLMPAFWIVVVPAILCGTSLYALGVLAAARPAVQFNLFVAARLPGLASAQAPLIAEEDARTAFARADERARRAQANVPESISARTKIEWAYVFMASALNSMEFAQDLALTRGLAREDKDLPRVVSEIDDTWYGRWMDAERAGEIASDAKAQEARADFLDASANWGSWLLLEPAAAEARNAAATAAIFVLAIAIAIAHYLLLIEFPFWKGQSSWKTAERVRTSAELMRLQLALQGEVVATQETTRRRTGSLSALWIAYNLAKDEAQHVKEIPVHTFTNGPDLLRKVAQLGVGSVATTLLGPAGGQVAKILGG